MSRKCPAWQLFSVVLMTLLVVGCFHPPYNNFKPYRHTPKTTAIGLGVGAAAGAVAGSTVIGLVAGGAAGLTVGLYKDSKKGIIRELIKEHIQFIEYGDTVTLIVPTDRYFLFNSSRLNEICYPGLINILKLVKFYPESTFYVAGFTDNIGSRRHKKLLSQAQAETMVTFLWANDVPARLLNAEGYGDKYPVADNDLIHGSAQNRRLEIQWVKPPMA